MAACGVTTIRFDNASRRSRCLNDPSPTADRTTSAITRRRIMGTSTFQLSCSCRLLHLSLPWRYPRPVGSPNRLLEVTDATRMDTLLHGNSVVRAADTSDVGRGSRVRTPCAIHASDPADYCSARVAPDAFSAPSLPPSSTHSGRDISRFASAPPGGRDAPTELSLRHQDARPTK